MRQGIYVPIILGIAMLVILSPSAGLTRANATLVKSPTTSSIYYVYEGKRYAFPNEKTFFTWYSDFSGVATIGATELAALPLAGNVTYRPGIKMVKITTDPKVYEVADGGVLQWVMTEELARLFHGDDWQREIQDVPDVFFSNYVIGKPIRLSGDYNPVRERDLQSTFIPRTPQTTTPSPEPPPVSSPAPLSTTYARVSYASAGGFIDHTVSVGDKIAVGDGINIRIDEWLTPDWVKYSIWGKDTSQSCKLLSATGRFSLGESDYRFREFTDSFFEVIDIAEDTIALRQYYGKAARERCDAISSWKRPIACSFYPADDRSYVENGTTRVFFSGEQSQLAAEYYTDAFNNCRAAFIQAVPAMANVTPIGRSHWDVYEALESTGAYSTDYQRISISPTRLSYSTETLQKNFEWIEGGKCPAEESAIAHELAHLLFARTFLQDIYDGGSKSEWTNSGSPRLGSVTLSEGFAQFMAHEVLGNAAQTERSYWQSFCGTDRLINADPERDFYGVGSATESQLRYSEILSGRGSGSNHYPAGYCFYDRIQTDCGDTAIKNLLTYAIQFDGSTASHSTMFRYLADQCGEATVTEAMDDFGFDRELLNLTQKWPNTGFPNGLDANGCLE